MCEQLSLSSLTLAFFLDACSYDYTFMVQMNNRFFFARKFNFDILFYLMKKTALSKGHHDFQICPP